MNERLQEALEYFAISRARRIAERAALPSNLFDDDVSHGIRDPVEVVTEHAGPVWKREAFSRFGPARGWF